MAYAQRTKLALKDLGEPALIKTKPENIRSLLLGTVVGECNEIVIRTNPKDDTAMEGLGGMFRSTPAEESAKNGHDPLESGVLFIPDAFHNIVAGRLREAKKTDPNAVVKFAFDVMVIRANNPIGYSWEFKPIFDEGESPLDKLMAEYTARKAAQIAKPAEQMKQVTGGKK